MSAITGNRTEPEPAGSISRKVTLDGCVNFRDLGGYATADGRRTRWRTVFRADGLNRLSGNDLDVLSAIGLGTVIDLRSRGEAEQRGSFPVDALPVRYVGLPLTDVLPTAEELTDWEKSSYVSSHYLDIVHRAAPALTAAFEALAVEGALPAVMHCSAGKDRTGVLSALLLAFLGVPDDTIVADYALSAAAMEPLLEHLKSEYPESVEAVTTLAPAILHVMPETMVEFLSGIRSEFGSYDGLVATLGVTGPVDHLRHTLLE